jgi:peroxiredoxin
MKVIAVLILTLLHFSAWGKGREALIGTRPPEWTVTNWLNSEPLHLGDLRGKVVLVRWWTAPGCPYCKATAPALNEFHELYSDQGLKVVGIYHHKDKTPLRLENVKKQAQKYGFEFPIAIDPDWRTLRQWWLGKTDENWTSVSFLLDRKGVIRHIHPGGEYIKGDKDYKEMKDKIEELLREP